MFWPSSLLLACSSSPVQADLSWLTFQAALPDSPVPAVWHAVLPRLLFPVVLPCCPATAVLSFLYYDDYPVPVVQFSVLLYIAVMFWSLSFFRPV
jgi:hypothetical protein